MRALVFCLALSFGLIFAPHAWAQSFPPGPWRGVWTTLDGQYEYQAELDFTTEMGGHVTGQIRWMLVRTPRPEQQRDIGARGIEFIEGAFDQSSGALNVRGVRLDDPHHILGIDEYRLVASPDGHYFVGVSGDNGAWQGRMDLAR